MLARANSIAMCLFLTLYGLRCIHTQVTGRTEPVKNNQNPQFTKPIEVDYFFDEVQKVRIDVYDIDSKTTKVTDDDHLGYVEARPPTLLRCDAELKLANQNRVTKLICRPMYC